MGFTEREKVRNEFAQHLNTLNNNGDIPYNVYSELFDFTMSLLDEMYQLGLKDGVMWRK